MKEIHLRIGNKWGLLTSILIVAMLCGTAIFITLQLSDTQKSVANTQAEATKQAGKSIGEGVCRSSERPFQLCGE